MTDALPIEVRKIAYRQSAKDGLVITFSVHPNDMPAALAAAPIGARFMAALVEIGDDEKPVEQVAPAKRKEYSLPQRVAMVCNEPRFHRFLFENDPYGHLWLRALNEANTTAEETAAEVVRCVCGVRSRSEILPSTEAARKWDELSGRYEGWKRGLE